MLYFLELCKKIDIIVDIGIGSGVIVIMFKLL